MTRTVRTTLLNLTLFAVALALAPAATTRAADVEPHGTGTTAAGAEDHGVKAELLRGPAEGGLITAVVTLIVFLLLVAVLGKFAWGPISKGLQEREDKIRRDIEEAEAARARAEASLKEYQAQLATAEARVREMLAKANTDAEQISGTIRARAQQEAQETKDNATREIDNARRAAVRQVHEEAAVLATRVAEKILRRNLNPDDQRDLVAASLDQVETIRA